MAQHPHDPRPVFFLAKLALLAQVKLATVKTATPLLSCGILVFLRKLNAGHADIAIEHAYGNRFEALSRAFALYARSGSRIEE